MVECAGLENRSPSLGGPWVRIPPPPLKARKQAGLPVGVSLGAGPSLCDDRCAARRPGAALPKEATRRQDRRTSSEHGGRLRAVRALTARRASRRPTRPCWPWNLGVSILEFRARRSSASRSTSPRAGSHPSGEPTGGRPIALEQGREAYARRKWSDAYRSRAPPTRRRRCRRRTWSCWPGAGTCSAATTTTRSGLERAHHAYVESGAARPAARCAWWIGHSLLFRGRPGPHSGGRLEQIDCSGAKRGDCVERGYVLISTVIESAVAGDHEAAQAVATEIAVARRALW